MDKILSELKNILTQYDMFTSIISGYLIIISSMLPNINRLDINDSICMRFRKCNRFSGFHRIIKKLFNGNIVTCLCLHLNQHRVQTNSKSN